MDVDLLARLQFAFTLMVHYVFPPLSIGLGVLLVAMVATYVKTRDPDYEPLPGQLRPMLARSGKLRDATT